MTKKVVKSIKNIFEKNYRIFLLGNKEAKALKTYVHEGA